MQKTVADYETVEVEETIKLCDCCKREEGDEDFINVEINPSLKTTEETEVVEGITFDNKFEARKEAGKRKYDGRNELPYEAAEARYKLQEKVSVDSLDSAAGADLCPGCICEVFGIDVDGDPIDVEVNRYGVEIKSEEVIEKQYPEIEIGIGSKFQAAAIVALFPFFILSSCIDVYTINRKKHMEDWQASAVLLVSLFGTLLWTGLTILGILFV